MDPLVLLSVLLIVGSLLTLWWGTRRARLSELSVAWVIVTFWMAARALESAEREQAFYRLLLWAAALLIYQVAHRWPALLTRLMPALAAIAAALSVADRLVSGGSPVGWLWDRNVTADLLLLLLPWGPNTGMWWGIALSALVLTGSRGALLGLIVALIVLIWRPKWWVALLAVVAASLVMALIRPGTALVRADIWQAAAQMIWQRPLTGWGIGTPIGPHWHAHNILMDAAVNGGFILALAWTWLIYAVFALVMGPPGSRARLGLLAVLLHGIVDCEIWTPMLLIAALNLALLVRHRETESIETAILVPGGDGAAVGAAAAA